MNLLTEYRDAHIVFLNNLVFELYDDITRNRIYEFYDRFSDVTCFLPRHLDDDNSLNFILIFDNQFNGVDSRIISVSIRNGVVGFDALCN